LIDLILVLEEGIDMTHNTEVWDKYTDDNEKNIQNDIGKFIYYTSLTLGAKKICEAGCNVGNNLSSFTSDFEVYGIDVNEQALNKAKSEFPNFIFKKDELKKTSFPDSIFDLVFTRGVLIHIPKSELPDVLKELLRISKKWIFNLEYFGKDGEEINWKRGKNMLWYRNMAELWKKFNVKIVSDVEIPIEIDPGKMRFTLIEKQ